MIDKTVDYSKFLKNKARIVHQSGMDIDESELHPSAFPHQRDAIRWALRVGKALIAMSFGLGKTHVQAEIAYLRYGTRYQVLTDRAAYTPQAPERPLSDFMREGGEL